MCTLHLQLFPLIRVHQLPVKWSIPAVSWPLNPIHQRGVYTGLPACSVWSSRWGCVWAKQAPGHRPHLLPCRKTKTPEAAVSTWGKMGDLSLFEPICSTALLINVTQWEGTGWLTVAPTPPMALGLYCWLRLQHWKPVLPCSSAGISETMKQDMSVEGFTGLRMTTCTRPLWKLSQHGARKKQEPVQWVVK